VDVKESGGYTYHLNPPFKVKHTPCNLHLSFFVCLFLWKRFSGSYFYVNCLITSCLKVGWSLIFTVRVLFMFFRPGVVGCNGCCCFCCCDCSLFYLLICLLLVVVSCFIAHPLLKLLLFCWGVDGHAVIITFVILCWDRWCSYCSHCCYHCICCNFVFCCVLLFVLAFVGVLLLFRYLLIVVL